MEIIVVLWRPTGVGAARPVHADKGVLGSGTAVNKGGVLLRGQAEELLWRRKVRDECLRRRVFWQRGGRLTGCGLQSELLQSMSSVTTFCRWRVAYRVCVCLRACVCLSACLPVCVLGQKCGGGGGGGDVSEVAVDGPQSAVPNVQQMVVRSWFH